MDLLAYWPTPEHIKECICTEAEELAEHTLLAVHEPMRLRREGSSGAEICSDEALLKEFLKVERPIPIIGRSGVGKSHLLRWLHAKLKIHPEAADWHIVRIPKNASLREVLVKLLANLEGETFELARQRVKTVGEQLNTHEVAQLLLTFMGQQLRRLHEDAQVTIEQYKRNGTTIDQDERTRLISINSHCGERGLSSLINDPHFQTYLLDEQHCVFQFAKRLIRGASDEELGDHDYQVHAIDLDFNYNLNDLAIPGRQYVQSAQLNTNGSKRQEAADMLNLVLGEATRTAFRQLFQFGGNNFQELFKQIRRDLFAKEQTLVVLVEDMAAISAIEDVLIDSLMEEGRYEEVETMCSIRSAIAVTDGYPGYLRRRDTLRTRAKAEWWIEESHDDEKEEVMQHRIVDFCSRYINAARNGSEALKKCWNPMNDTQWPPIWENEVIDRQHLDAFGRVRNSISLYPLSPLAIRALVNKNCRDDQGQLRFNPRQVINQILLKILRDCRGDAERDQFPPVALGGISASVTLRSDLARLGLENPERCQSLAAIWGYGAETLDKLKETLSADIAISFGYNDLSQHLRAGGVKSEPDVQEKGDKAGERRLEQKPAKKEQPSVDPGEQKLKALMTKVELWCRREKDLAQEEAKILRKALATMYQTYGRKEWTGLAELPAIKSGTRVNITLPYAASNIGGWLIEFCSEADFTDSKRSIFFHNAARTILRYSHFNPEPGDGKGWNYPTGHEDFLHYQNFAAYWVPSVLRTLREQERIRLDDFMEKHVVSARSLAVFKESDNYREHLNKLFLSQQALEDTFPTSVCETVLIERQTQLAQWEVLQRDWLKLLASNDHGLEGDLALKALKNAMHKPLPNRINQATIRSLGELQDESACVAWLADCGSADDFYDVMQKIDTLIRQLRAAGRYPQNSENIVTSQTLTAKLKKIIEPGHFEQIRKMKRIGEAEEVERQWQIINELDGDKIRPLVDAFDKWQAVYDQTLPSLLNKNSVWGGERVIEAKNTIDALLTSLHKMISEIQGESDGNA